MKRIFLLLLPFTLSADLPKAVVFDFGGVIATSNYTPLASFMSKTMGTPKPPIKKTPSNRKLRESLNRPPGFWERRTGKSLSKSWADTYKENQQLLYNPIPGMRQVIQTLKQLEIQVAILSNVSEGRAGFLHSKGAYNAFNPVLLSCNLGVKKPEKKVYEILLNTLDVSPEQCVFIDNKKRNVEAAQALGIDGIVFYSSKQLKEELLKRGIEL